MYLCICMKKFLWIVMIVAVGIVLCSRSEQHRLILTEAGSMAALYPDSALKMLDIIDPADLDEDSLKAAYALAMATAHKAAKSSMVSDSLTGYAFDYYRNKDFEKFLQAGDLYALHRFWLGEGDAALALLDSLIALPTCRSTQRLSCCGQELCGRPIGRRHQKHCGSKATYAD